MPRTFKIHPSAFHADAVEFHLSFSLSQSCLDREVVNLRDHAARWRVAPGGTVTGSFTVPGDKSISHRALMLAAIAQGETHIRGFLEGEDCLATARALAALGVRIERPAPTLVRVHGAGAGALRAASGPLDMGNAGTAMRLMMGLLAPRTFDARVSI